MRDAVGMLLVVFGLAWVLLTRDKLGLVIAFAGVTVLAFNYLKADSMRPPDGREPPIF